MATAMMRPRTGSSMTRASKPLGREHVEPHQCKEGDADGEKGQVLHGPLQEMGRTWT
jgi:hypothetical protein